MLIFAKDITERDHKHIGEDRDPELKAYMEYQRKLFPYTIIRAGLDLAYKELDDILLYVDNDYRPPEGSSRQDYPADVKGWYRSRFPWSAGFLEMEDLHFLLVSMVKAMDLFRAQEPVHSFHLMALYDSVHNVVQVYNDLLKTSAQNARDIHLSSGVAVDFDDFINNYWPHLDFMILSKPDYPHARHMDRNREIEMEVRKQIGEGDDPPAALRNIAGRFGLDANTLSLLLREPVQTSQLELESNPLTERTYESLYEETEEDRRFGRISRIDADYLRCFELSRKTPAK